MGNVVHKLSDSSIEPGAHERLWLLRMKLARREQAQVRLVSGLAVFTTGVIWIMVALFLLLLANSYLESLDRNQNRVLGVDSNVPTIAGNGQLHSVLNVSILLVVVASTVMVALAVHRSAVRILRLEQRVAYTDALACLLTSEVLVYIVDEELYRPVYLKQALALPVKLLRNIPLQFEERVTFAANHFRRFLEAVGASQISPETDMDTQGVSSDFDPNRTTMALCNLLLGWVDARLVHGWGILLELSRDQIRNWQLPDGEYLAQLPRHLPRSSTPWAGKH